MRPAASHYAGKDMLALTPREFAPMRGREIAMIFQDPMSSLNPVLTIADQIGETLRIHQELDAAASRQRAIELLELVRIPDARRRIDEYPHRLSGGMRQRVMIAIAIACRPRLLIADEPTTALDVTIQAQILDLLRELQSSLGMSVILISHDMGVIAEFARRVVVMYAGRVVETAPVRDCSASRSIPTPRACWRRFPSSMSMSRGCRRSRGSIPDPAQVIPGCRYSPRCADCAVDSAASKRRRCCPPGASRFARCPPRVASAMSADAPIAGVRDLVKIFPVGATGAEHVAASCRQSASASISATVRHWAWSANPVPANRPSAGCWSD